MARNGDVGYTAFRLLQVAFVIVPFWAGLDKFFYVLGYWPMYISPFLGQTIAQGYVNWLMLGVGVVEMIAGIGVAIIPRVFAYIVALWLLLIIINFILLGHFFDIALRDLGLLLGAVSLGLLAQKYK